MNKISLLLKNAAAVAAFFALCLTSLAQDPKPATAPAGATASAMTASQAITLAQQGRCNEALAGLKKAATAAPSKEDRKTAGVLGVRCAMAIDNRVAAGDFLGQLGKQFPQDPAVLFVLVHAYSDLSSRAGADLSEHAPQSVEARKLNAEALEIQGRWDDAAKQYEEIIAQNPSLPGMHYLLGRVYLSRPDPPDEATLAKAKQEFVKELEIDPKNAGAEYVLGELARQNSEWDAAAVHFSKAASLDVNFADAYAQWGLSLISAREYDKAVAPLQTAVRMQPGNPAVHYNLGIALSRTGKTEEAQREFAIQKEIIKRLDERRNAQGAPSRVQQPQQPQQP